MDSFEFCSIYFFVTTEPFTAYHFQKDVFAAFLKAIFIIHFHMSLLFHKFLIRL